MRKRFITFIFLLLVSIVACLGILACGCDNDGNETPNQYRIACFGDSITEGIGVEQKTNLYVNVLRKEEYITGAQNVGVAGSTVAYSEKEVMNGYSFVERYKQISSATDLIFVFGGTNDFNNNVPIGEIGDETVQTFYGALNVLKDGFAKSYPNAKVLFATPLQRDDEWFGEPETTPYNANGNTLSDFRDAIISFCEANKIEYVDLYNLDGMRLQDASFKTHFADGLHPNDEGSKLIAQAVAAKLKQMLNIDNNKSNE